MESTRLTLSPQADTVSPTAKMLRAAFTSRSCVSLQDGHCHSRTPSGMDETVCPQQEQRLLEGYHRSIPASVRPYHSALYDRNDRNCDQPESEIAFDSLGFFTMFFTVSVSTAMNWFSRINLVESLWWKSRRLSAILACIFATLCFAFSRFFEPLVFRLKRRCNSARRCSCFLKYFGLSIFSPSDVMAKCVNPRSIPTLPFETGKGWISSSTRTETKYRPAASLLTVTVEGLPVNSRLQHMFNGSACFASFSLPSLQLKALDAYVADWRDCFFLKFGYLALPEKKFWYAV